MRALLGEAVDGWRPLAGALGGELLFDRAGPRLLVHADRLRLVQAVGNLVLNALEHGAGPVRIRAHATRAHVRIEVRDQGPGLPAPVAALAARRPARRPPRTRPRDRGARRPAPRRPPAHRTGERGRLRRPRAAARGARAARAGSEGTPPAHGPAVSRRRRAAVLLGLALVLGGLAASDVARRESAVRAQLGPAVQVVVARADLRAGRPVAAGDLALRQVPARYAPVGAAVPPGDADRATARGPGRARRVPRRGDDRDRAGGRRPAGPAGRARGGGGRAGRAVARRAGRAGGRARDPRRRGRRRRRHGARARGRRGAGRPRGAARRARRGRRARGGDAARLRPRRGLSSQPPSRSRASCGSCRAPPATTSAPARSSSGRVCGERGPLTLPRHAVLAD